MTLGFVGPAHLPLATESAPLAPDDARDVHDDGKAGQEEYGGEQISVRRGEH